MSALPLGRYRQLLRQLLRLNERAAALRRELTEIADDSIPERHFLDSSGDEEDGDGDGDGDRDRDRDRLGEYLSEMTEDAGKCAAMRRAGCVELLVRLIHEDESDGAARALRNVVRSQTDERAARRELRVLRLLEAARHYVRRLEADPEDDAEHPTQSAAALMKLSFDEEHRRVVCRLGGLRSLAALVVAETRAHGAETRDARCVAVRKYAGMALTNLTFGDGENKALLCSYADFVAALVAQLRSPDDDAKQVTAAVLRNLSWRADAASKRALREAKAVGALTAAAMSTRKEATLKSALSALWNLTAHCSRNKEDVCEVDGALAFLVEMLEFDAPSKTLAVVENAGGILRNVSSRVAVREDHRRVLRERDCLGVLLRQLESPSLTVVSNSCGTLWNLSARCRRDQRYLWERGAVPLLRSLVRSKHKMIAIGSSAALKNLLNSKAGEDAIETAKRADRRDRPPILGARKLRALEHELDESLAETCENVEPPNASPTSDRDDDADGRLGGLAPRARFDFSARRKPSDGGSVASAPSGSIYGGRDFLGPFEIERDPTVSLGDYRETDLDRPTDYSLRYSEERVDPTANARVVCDDAIKHFCTEGTPYETPVNFSTANSMTDLRSAGVPEDAAAGRGDVMTGSDEKDACSIDDVVSHDNDRATRRSKNANSSFDSKYASGVSSPEKPINYCEEGTPGYFSRVSSLSSLNENDDEKRRKDSKEKEEGERAVPDYAEETPLMFSRSSSVDSISECSVPGQPDDVGSIVSEFSRLPSECISPSELPDSPTQSPFPKLEGSNNFVAPNKTTKHVKIQLQSTSKLRSVFEDEVATFHFEHTPVEFSTGTSLSSLTIDDEPVGKVNSLKPFDIHKRSDGVGCSDPKKIDSFAKVKNKKSKINSKENILKECIDIGVQLSIKNKSSVVNKAKTSKNLILPNNSGIPLPEDTCHTYCTEDTPAALSKAGSHSDLSTLSIIDNENTTVVDNDTSLQIKKDFSDDSSNISCDSDNLLAECIYSGIPKATLPMYIVSNDEVENYAIEDSPFHHSPSSSLSDLTVESKEKAGVIKRNEMEKNGISRKPEQYTKHLRSSVESISSVSGSSDDGQLLNMAIDAGVPRPNAKKTSMDDKFKRSTLNKSDSLSSLSVDSVGSNECEKALFEQCIKSGMPKLNSETDHVAEHDNSNTEFEGLVAVGAFGSLKKKGDTDNCTSSKNVQGTSVIANSQNAQSFPVAITDVNSAETTNEARDIPADPRVTSKISATEPLMELNSTVTNGFEDSSFDGKPSLDEDKQNLDTWNESMYLNGPSFSTISNSAPMLASFKSDVTDEASFALGLPDLLEKSSICENSNRPDLTSKLENGNIFRENAIKNEAKRLALLINRNYLMENEQSTSSLDLDNVRPPSHMGSLISLTQSVSGHWDESTTDNPECDQQSVVKKSKSKCLLTGIIAKKALGLLNGYANLDTNDSLISNLDNVRPPSEMDDILDMENSILSIASMNSDVVDGNETSVATQQSNVDNLTDRKENVRLTPRQRRQMSNERYKTYTVMPQLELLNESLENKVNCESDAVQKPIASPRKSIKQRRLENSDRFRTRVLNEELALLNNFNTRSDICTEKNIKNTAVNNNDPGKPKIINEFDSLDYDQNSGTESADQNLGSDSDPDLQQVINKPIITKPTSGAHVDECGPKTIRGRRKGLYVSPYKHNATKKSPARNNVANKHTKPITNATKTLSKNHSFLKRPPINDNKNNDKSKSKNPDKQSQILVRQATFTKEESTVLQSANSETVPKIAQSSSKILKPGSITRASKLQAPTPIVKNCLVLNTRKVEATSPPQQNLKGNKIGTTKKDASSKIASLWKKVEENKKLQPKTDSRVWIKGSTDESESKPTVGSKSKLVRSSTFESSSKHSKDLPPEKQKSSISIKESRKSNLKYNSRVPVIKPIIN